MTIFLIAFLIVFTFVTIATEIEWFGCSTLTLTASVILVQYFHLLNIDILIYVKEHILNTIAYSLSYIAIGIAWSFAKWFFFLRNELEKSVKYVKELKEFVKQSPVINIPQASYNKGRIIAWMSFWPFSFIGTLLNDPIRKLFNQIFNQFKNLYQRMANNIFASDIARLEFDIKMARDEALEKENKVRNNIK